MKHLQRASKFKTNYWLPHYCQNISKIKTRGEDWEYTFLKSPPGNFRFVTLPQEVLEKKAFTLETLQVCVTHLGNSKVKNQDPWKFRNNNLICILGFLEHPWNFHCFFNWTLEFLRVFSSRSQEVPCPHVFIFFPDKLAS